MSNSSLVNYTKISPNKSINRKHAIDTITIHCVVGQLSVETLGNIFAPQTRKASSNYGIGSDGRIGMYVEEKDRSWCTSNAANDNRAITIECASDKTAPYSINQKVYNSLINLLVDICKRNNIPKLLWKADKSLIGQVDKQNITAHRWFAATACPGDYIYSRLGQIAEDVNKILNPVVFVNNDKTTFKFLNMKPEEVIKTVGPLFTADQKATGVLASLSMAQFILESGWGTSELAQKANNFFGMKKNLSRNTWENSKWDGKSIYEKETKEQNSDGTYTSIIAEFRKYPTMADSIADHSAYLLGAMNGKAKRYNGLKGETDYLKAATILKNGGYATSLTYVDKLSNLIKKWNLTYYDVKQVPVGFQPYTVRTTTSYLYIRKGPGTNYDTNGFTGAGVFTIVDEKIGMGSNAGWGKLKSGAGWISLDYTKKV